jgi:hypothetical protein
MAETPASMEVAHFGWGAMRMKRKGMRGRYERSGVLRRRALAPLAAIPVILLGLGLAVGCGAAGTGAKSTGMTTPTPSFRDVGSGANVKLSSGLEITVPRGLSGFVARGGVGGPAEQVGLSAPIADAERLSSLGVVISSLTADDLAAAAPFLRSTPVIGVSRDGTVEVRWRGRSTRKHGGVSRLVITVRLPNRLVGRIDATALGGAWVAHDVMEAKRQACRLWEFLQVKGASFPPLVPGSQGQGLPSP